MTTADVHACELMVESADGTDCSTLRVRGHLDWTNVEAFRAAVASLPATSNVVIDLKGSRSDASGTAALIAATLEITGRAQALAFVTTDQLEADALSSVGIDELAHVATTVEEARRALTH